ncbi:MAG: histidine phosphatase family protein [Desulfobacterota bacterium]|nr:histidine phosphatase family protein [Thermodesulfobacteriota bacterium]MDW8002111.1 histidine phosphatase family protein [Deltaproteobacteria bacterium]
MKIFLVRHGETEWNKEEVFRGKVDVPLNDKGLDQAKKTGSYLVKFSPEKVYSSPLQRARQTASIIAEINSIPLYLLDELTDMSFGIWEGLSLNEVKTAYPLEFEIWKRCPEKWRMDGAENLKKVRRRVSKAVEKILKENGHGKNVVLVTHRVICKVISLIFLGLPNSGFWRIKFDPASVSIFEYDGSSFVTTLLNNTSHLDHLGVNYSDF